MAEIVNLRQARKGKRRTEQERTAEANRLRFGRTKAEKQQGRLEEARLQRLHAAHRRQEPAED